MEVFYGTLWLILLLLGKFKKKAKNGLAANHGSNKSKMFKRGIIGQISFLVELCTEKKSGET